MISPRPPAPGTMYVSKLHAVVLDATADEPALKTQEDRAAAMAPRRDGIDMAMAMMVLRVGWWCWC